MPTTLKDVISSAMPFIGSLLGGPLGGKAGEFLSKTLTGNIDASDSEIQQKFLSFSPDKFIELRKIDEQYKEKLISAQIDSDKIESDDRDSAQGSGRKCKSEC